MMRLYFGLGHDLTGFTGGFGCFPRLNKQHDGGYLVEQLATCLKVYGIDRKVCHVGLLID